ncbi:Fc.00g075510.m01.CDS01 [Cosmosporella sp. VM-42]
MPSVKNPNHPSKNRLAARRSSAKKVSRKRTADAPKSKIEKADSTRGARPGLMPTSGPRKPISAKRARKLEKKMGYAMKRKMEAEGEAEMKDAPETNATKNEVAAKEVTMEEIQ